MSMDIVRKRVVSSNIDKIGYEDGVLVVEFIAKAGAAQSVWQYSGVPEDVWEQMNEPDASAGRIFAQCVKGAPGVYAVKIGEVPPPVEANEVLAS